MARGCGIGWTTAAGGYVRQSNANGRRLMVNSPGFAGPLQNVHCPSASARVRSGMLLPLFLCFVLLVY